MSSLIGTQNQNTVTLDFSFGQLVVSYVLTSTTHWGVRVKSVLYKGVEVDFLISTIIEMEIVGRIRAIHNLTEE